MTNTQNKMTQAEKQKGQTALFAIGFTIIEVIVINYYILHGLFGWWILLFFLMALGFNGWILTMMDAMKRVAYGDFSGKN